MGFPIQKQDLSSLSRTSKRKVLTAKVSLLFLSTLCLVCWASCATSPIGPHDRIGPVLIETPAGANKFSRDVTAERTGEERQTAAAAEPPYNIFSMVYTINEGMFRRLDLDKKLSRKEKLQLLQRFFYRDTLPGKEGELRLQVPDYFEKGDLLITLNYYDGPPERFEWTSNALVNPLTGGALKGRGEYVKPKGMWRNLGESLVIRGGHLVRENDLYSRERELRLRAKGELLLLAYADVLDEFEHTDRRGKMIIDGILTTPDLPYEQTASAYCLLARYHLKHNDYRAAEKSLEAASRFCVDGPLYLHSLYMKVREEYLLSKALFRG
ncbi:MAG: hypothetical protein R6V67_02235 [Spirochaetia bacterium]